MLNLTTRLINAAPNSSLFVYNPKIDVSLTSQLKPLSCEEIVIYYASINHKVSATSSKIYYYKPLDCYFSPFLTYGNIKLSPNISIFATWPKRNCVCSTKECRASCYAEKDLRNPDPVFKRAITTYLRHNDPEFLFSCIDDQLSRKTTDYSRLNEAGDFSSQRDVDFWTWIARRHEETRFYGYTRTESIFDFSKFLALNNTNLVNSFIEFRGHRYNNFGQEEFIQALSALTGIAICPNYNPLDLASNGKPRLYHCGTECHACMYAKNMLFRQH